MIKQLQIWKWFQKLMKKSLLFLNLQLPKKKNQILVGFALETNQELAHAKKKLKEKKLDLIVLNSLQDPGAGFGHLTNKVTVIEKNGKVHDGVLKLKSEVAADICDIITA